MALRVAIALLNVDFCVARARGIVTHGHEVRLDDDGRGSRRRCWRLDYTASRSVVADCGSMMIRLRGRQVLPAVLEVPVAVTGGRSAVSGAATFVDRPRGGVCLEVGRGGLPGAGDC